MAYEVVRPGRDEESRFWGTVLPGEMEAPRCIAPAVALRRLAAHRFAPQLRRLVDVTELQELRMVGQPMVPPTPGSELKRLHA